MAQINMGYGQFAGNNFMQPFNTFAGRLRTRYVQYQSNFPRTHMALVKGEIDHHKTADADVAVIEYPITFDDTCDCVTFPETDFELVPCDADLQWGLFQVYFTDGECVDVVFDEAEVFARCPSGLAQTTEAYSEYLWCKYDFSNPPTMVDATTKMKVAPSGDTKTASLRQETTAEVKKKGHTHVHLTVHRMLTLVLETVLALQAPWV